jgi:CBS domain containing-hemolysin-like protein
MFQVIKFIFLIFISIFILIFSTGFFFLAAVVLFLENVWKESKIENMKKNVNTKSRWSRFNVNRQESE